MLANLVLSGAINSNQFEKLKMVVEHAESITRNDLSDPMFINLLEWIRRGGIYRSWSIEKGTCPQCGEAHSIRIASKGLDDCVICMKNNCRITST